MTQKIDYITECKNYLDIMLTKHGDKAFSNKDFIKIAFEYEYSSDFWRELAIKHGEPLINWTLENFNYFPYDDNENFTEFFIKAKKPHLVSFIWKNKHFKEKHLNDVTSSYAYNKFNESYTAFEHGNYDIIKFLWEDESCFTDFSSDLINDFENKNTNLFFSSLLNNNPNALRAFLEICKDWFSKNKNDDDYQQYIYKLAFSILPKDSINLHIINPITLEYLLFYSDIKHYFNVSDYLPVILKIMPEINDEYDLKLLNNFYSKTFKVLDVDNEQIIEKSLLEAIKQKNTLIFNELFNKNKQLSKKIIENSSLLFLYKSYENNPQNIDFFINLFKKENISIQNPVLSDFSNFLFTTIQKDLPLENLFKIINKEIFYEYINNNTYEFIQFSSRQEKTFNKWIDILLSIHQKQIFLTDEQKFSIIQNSFYNHFSENSLSKVISNKEYEEVIVKNMKKIIRSQYFYIDDILNYSHYSNTIINGILNYCQYDEFKNISDSTTVSLFEHINPESFENNKKKYLNFLLSRIDLKKLEDIENHIIYKLITKKIIDTTFKYNDIKECNIFNENKNIQTLLSFTYMNNKYTESKKEKKMKI